MTQERRTFRYRSRGTGHNPVPNKPTVSVDVKQHFNWPQTKSIEQIITAIRRTRNAPCGVPFRMTSARSEKPICSPPRLAEVSPALPSKQFHCSSDRRWPCLVFCREAIYIFRTYGGRAAPAERPLINEAPSKRALNALCLNLG